MDRIHIRGGKQLNGRLPISGAKNAALTLLPCALLTDEPVALRNLPRLADVDSFGHLLNQLGVSTMIERLQRGAAQGELAANTDPAVLGKFINTVMEGMSVQARDGATINELLSIAKMALDRWPAAI